MAEDTLEELAYSLLDKMVAYKVVGTLLEQLSSSLGIQLDKKGLDMVEDTFEGVEPSS